MLTEKESGKFINECINNWNLNQEILLQTYFLKNEVYIHPFDLRSSGSENEIPIFCWDLENKSKSSHAVGLNSIFSRGEGEEKQENKAPVEG